MLMKEEEKEEEGKISCRMEYPLYGGLELLTGEGGPSRRHGVADWTIDTTPRRRRRRRDDREEEEEERIVDKVMNRP